MWIAVAALGGFALGAAIVALWVVIEMRRWRM